MKRIIILFLILLMTTGTKRYLDGTSGNDANGGTSWADAWATLGKLNTAATNGDTIYVVNTFTEKYTPTHTGLVFIDSLRENGWTDSQPDTSWSAIFDGGTGNTITLDIATGDNNLKFIGIYFKEGTLWNVRINNGAYNIWMQQCKFEGDRINLVDADTVNIISNLFISNGSDNYAIQTKTASSQLNIYNNTIYGEYLVTGIGEVKADSINIQNNIIVNTSSVSFDVTTRIDLSSDAKKAIKTWDYNDYYKSTTDTWRFVNFFSTFATWIDSVNNYGAGATNESHSLNTDPQLQATATTAYILNTSPAYNAGVDLGYGTSIGYYQPAATGIDSTYILRDNFTGINGTNLDVHDSNWRVFSGDDLEIQSNEAAGGLAGGNIGFWKEFEIQSTRASIKLSAKVDGGWIGVYGRFADTTSTSTIDGYAVFWDFIAGAGNDEVSIQKLTNGSHSDLGSRAIVEATVGDSIEIRISGGNIQALVNNSVKLEIADSTYPNKGFVGLNISNANSVRGDDLRFGTSPVIVVANKRRRQIL